jgi:hypothetical protein
MTTLIAGGGLKSNRTMIMQPYSTVMQTATSTIDISSIMNSNKPQAVYTSNAGNNITNFVAKNELTTIQEPIQFGLPKVTEVWRWVKNLVKSYIALKQQQSQI